MPGTTSKGIPARAGTALPCRRCRRRTGRPTSVARRSCRHGPSRRAAARSRPGRAACGAAAPTSIFSASARASRSSRAEHAAVVDHHVRAFEPSAAADADQAGIPGPAPTMETSLAWRRGQHHRTKRDGHRTSASELEGAGRGQLVGQAPAQLRGQVRRTTRVTSDSPASIERRHHRVHVEVVAVVERDGAERQLTAAAERRDERSFGVERLRRAADPRARPARAFVSRSSCLVSIATIP